jgi:hypothetical protein
LGSWYGHTPLTDKSGPRSAPNGYFTRSTKKPIACGAAGAGAAALAAAPGIRHMRLGEVLYEAGSILRSRKNTTDYYPAN